MNAQQTFQRGYGTEPRGRERFFASISRHLRGLYRYARHLISYHEQLGDLPPGQVDIEAVIDRAIIEAYGELGRETGERDLRRRLVRHARAYVDAEIGRLNAGSAQTPSQQRLRTLGEEVLYFFEQDEDLKIQDVVPDLVMPGPEQEAELESLRECADGALDALPRQWRRALVLRYSQDMRGVELAKALGVSVVEGPRILDHARQYLREKLLDGGCNMKPRDTLPRSRHRTLPALPEAQGRSP